MRGMRAVRQSHACGRVGLRTTGGLCDMSTERGSSASAATATHIAATHTVMRNGLGYGIAAPVTFPDGMPVQ